MVLSRFSRIGGRIGQTTFRGARGQARNRAWRQIGRRTYASEHGAEKSSELPWIIGSVVVTVPSAAWLWQQGPTKSDHGHDEHEEHEESEESEDKSEEKEGDEGQDDGGDGEDGKDGDDDSKAESEDDDSKDEDSKKNDSKDKKKPPKSKDDGKDSKDEGQSDDSESDSDDEKDTPSTSDDEEGDSSDSKKPGQINQNSKKGPGELQKGSRPKTDKKGEKDAAGDYSGANHPNIDDPEKSKKSSGVTATAKTHGSVDTTK